MRINASTTASSIWIKYFFYGWLFKDVTQAKNLFQYNAAVTHNKENAKWLPVYIQRWGFLMFFFFGSGYFLEKTSIFFLIGTAYVLAICAFMFIIVTFVIWQFLTKVR